MTLWAALMGAAVDDGISLRNARAVWKDGRAHLVIDCADRAEYAERQECGFGAICCALLPDALDEAVHVQPGGPFVANVARNALRIDGAFAPGTYEVEVRPPLRTRRGTGLARVFRASVQVPQPPAVALPAASSVPVLPPDGAPEPPVWNTASAGTGAAPVVTEGDNTRIREDQPWLLRLALAQPPAGAHAEVSCFARLAGSAREKAACTSFHFDALFAWTAIGSAHAQFDARGRASVQCPALHTFPLVHGSKDVAAVAVARDANSRLIGQVLAHASLAGSSIVIGSAVSAGEVKIEITVAASACGANDSLEVSADAVGTEWAWDWAAGRERSVVQPWRQRLARTRFHAPRWAQITTGDRTWKSAWEFSVPQNTTHVLVTAHCGGDEAVHLVATDVRSGAVVRGPQGSGL